MEYKLYYILLILEKTLPNTSHLMNMLFFVWGVFFPLDQQVIKSFSEESLMSCF